MSDDLPDDTMPMMKVPQPTDADDDIESTGVGDDVRPVDPDIAEEAGAEESATPASGEEVG